MKDARASQGAVIELFERLDRFFKRLGVYTQISLTTEMADVLVKIVIELLSILSIATKEVKRPLSSEFELSRQETLRSSARSCFFLQRSLLGNY
jgi:hypothetical protein